MSVCLSVYLSACRAFESLSVCLSISVFSKWRSQMQRRRQTQRHRDRDNCGDRDKDRDKGTNTDTDTHTQIQAAARTGTGTVTGTQTGTSAGAEKDRGEKSIHNGAHKVAHRRAQGHRAILPDLVQQSCSETPMGVPLCRWGAPDPVQRSAVGRKVFANRHMCTSDGLSL